MRITLSPYSVNIVTIVEGVLRQILDIAFHGLEIIGAREEPCVTLLGANTAIALKDVFDLWTLQLKDECTAVTVAAICLGSPFSHA